MARHQVLQRRLVSCTSAIPHPFCQRHPKIQFRASPVVAPAGVFAPALPRPQRRVGRCRACRHSVSMHDPCLISTTRPPPKHPYPSTTSSTPPPSIGTTLPQRNNSNSSVPQRNNANSSVDKTITMHPHDAGQLHSVIRPSVTLHRHDAFLS